MIDAAAGGPTGAVPYLRLPDPRRLFEDRAGRFATLALGHAAADYVGLLARIARGQARAVREVHPAAPAGPRPGATPLAPDRLPRDGAWRRMLAIVLAEAQGAAVTVEARLAVRRLADLGVSQLEAVADEVLAGQLRRDRPDALAVAPFVGAALQAWFASLAATLDPAKVARAESGCPVCGSPPVAGVVQGDDRLRYLACSLCGSRWHLERAHCAVCRGTEGLAYFSVDGDPGASAEACDRCKAYVKQFDLEKRPGAEPLADDAATLALDLLVAEEGFARAGVNLLLVAGA